MAAERAHHRTALAFGVRWYGVTEVAQGRARIDRPNAAHHGFVRQIHQPLSFARHIADAVHAARIAVPAIDDDGDIYVEDIAILQVALRRDAMADRVIGRRAN